MKDLIKEYGEYFTLKYWMFMLFIFTYTIIDRYLGEYLHFLIKIAIILSFIILYEIVFKPKKQPNSKDTLTGSATPKEDRKYPPFIITFIYMVLSIIIVDIIEYFLIK